MLTYEDRGDCGFMSARDSADGEFGCNELLSARPYVIALTTYTAHVD